MSQKDAYKFRGKRRIQKFKAREGSFRFPLSSWKIKAFSTVFPSNVSSPKHIAAMVFQGLCS